MNGSKRVILACLLAATCCASQGNISSFSAADDAQDGTLCYNCNYLVTDPRACTHKARCSRDEVCMLHEKMPGADGSKRYTAQCETELVCQNLRNHAKKRSHVFCHNCCNKDLCNDHCGGTPTTPMPTPTIPTTPRPTPPTPPKTKAPTPKPTTKSTTTPKPTTTATTTTEAATTTKPTHHVVYPIMCYSCTKMVDPSSCRHLVTCQKGFGCMLQEVGVDSDFQILYTSSCEPDWLCNRMPHSADALIGKRSETSQLEIKPEVGKRSRTCNKCCHRHLCNSHCDAFSSHVSATTPPNIPPTHVATHKTTTRARVTTNKFSATPLHVKTRGTTAAHAQATSNSHYKQENCIKHNFTSIPYINLCFKLETVALKWNVAERWCGFYGATLAVLDDPGKFSVVETVLRYEPHFHNEVVYIGGHDEFSNGTFYWPDHKRVSVESWSDLNFQHSAGRCIGLDGTNGFQMTFIDCDIYRKFICTIDTS